MKVGLKQDGRGRVLAKQILQRSAHVPSLLMSVVTHLDVPSDSGELLIWQRTQLVDILVGDDEDVGIVACNLEHAILEKSRFELQPVRLRFEWLYVHKQIRTLLYPSVTCASAP